MLLYGVVFLVAYGVVPVARNRHAVWRLLTRLQNRPITIFAGLYLLVFFVVGLFGPIVYEDPGLNFGYAFQPPIGFSGELTAPQCAGDVTGGAFDRRCHGSWSYPLGTNHRGYPLGYLLIEGARIAVYVTVFTAAFVVPIATGLGIVTGLHGGIVDDILMSIIDVQMSIPAILLYFVGYAIFNPSLLLLLVSFGLLSWGGITRLVRSETLRRRERGHVLVARSLGAPNSYLARRHILPNVTNTVVPAMFQLLALLVLIEAGIAFLGFHELELYSWGSTISESINAQIAGQHQIRADRPASDIWWVSAFPALILTVTISALKVVGDGLRDALDPRL
ncbi:ABC-type transport system permease [Halovivax asiaticus JCM 14624]|uniref:ABC-type transport system permease n=1 Tax=Halovivax asiaticus JCM 14624 TaxID=1227490 RepID=M0BTD7_9EURY|nr:ABC-type transport system permease [Halovivax asiaticus JCM 14624]